MKQAISTPGCLTVFASRENGNGHHLCPARK